jgi:oxalate decarboxylase
MISRRKILAATAAGAVVGAVGTARTGSVGNPDEPPQGAISASPEGLSGSGPQTPGIANQFP